MLIDVGVSIAHRRKPRWHRRQREVAWLAGVDLVPGQRRRDARVRLGPYRVGGRDGAILRVLVVVEEHAVALFFPPLARGEVGGTAFDLAREGKRGAAYLGERPAPLDANVNVNASR